MTLGESGPKNSVGEVLSGRVVARFTYTSRGSAGWGVAGSVGSAPKQVMNEAIGFIEQLSSPVGYEAPPDHARDARLLWTKSESGPWRFLLNSVSAGTDASERPNNCFTDCLIVQADDSSDGADPAAFWGTETWIKPYGADEVASVDLAALGKTALEPVASPAQLPVLVDYLTREGQGLGYLDGLIRMVFAVFQNREAAKSTWIGIERPPQAEADALAGLASLQVGKNLMSVLFELLPFDVAWDTTFEIRYTRDTPLSHASSVALHLMPSGYLPETNGCVLIGSETLGLEREMVACDTCGQAIHTWADVLILCLEQLESMVASGERDSAVRLAGQLNDYCRQLRLERIPAGQYPDMFLPSILADRNRDLAALLDGRHFSHEHLLAHAYVPNLEEVVDELAQCTPDDLTYAVADRQFERHSGGRLPDSAEHVLQVHRLLGQPPADAQQYLERVSAALNDQAFVRVLNSGGPLRSGVAGRVLRSLAILACSDYTAARLPERIDAALVLWALSHHNSKEWGAPIRHPELFDKYLRCWVSVQGIPGDVSHLLSRPPTRHNGSSFPLGYELTRMALEPANEGMAGIYLDLLDEAKRTTGIDAIGFDALSHLQRWVRSATGDGAFVMTEGQHA